MRVLQFLLWALLLRMPGAAQQSIEVQHGTNSALTAAKASFQLTETQQPAKQHLARPAWLKGGRSRDDESRQQAAAATQQKHSVARSRGVAIPYAPPKTNRFIVQLKMPSAASALEATAQPSSTNIGSNLGTRGVFPRTGRITPQAAAASVAVLSQVEAVASAANVQQQVSHRYSYALSGFAVENPTAAQLQALSTDPQVLSVVRDNSVRYDTYSTPRFLGLTNKQDSLGANHLRHNQDAGAWGEVGHTV